MDRLSEKYEKEGIPYTFPIIIRNENNKRVYYENALGDWSRSEFDENGNHIFNQTSSGFWWKRIYDSNSNVKFYKDSTGVESNIAFETERPIRAVVIDDDPIVALCMRERVASKFKDVIVETQCEPTIQEPAYDIYIIDNEFDGVVKGPELVKRINVVNENALIVAMSGTLTPDMLTILVNRGCNGIYDKRNPGDNDTVFDVILGYINRLKHTRERDNAIDSMSFRTLLKYKWNKFRHKR